MLRIIHCPIILPQPHTQKRPGANVRHVPRATAPLSATAVMACTAKTNTAICDLLRKGGIETGNKTWCMDDKSAATKKTIRALIVRCVTDRSLMRAISAVLGRRFFGFSKFLCSTYWVQCTILNVICQPFFVAIDTTLPLQRCWNLIIMAISAGV